MVAVAGNGLNVTDFGTVFFESTSFTSITPGVAGTVLTSAGASSLPVWSPASTAGFPWTDEAISFAAASNNGYFVTAVSTATLPASPSQGDTISFATTSAGILTITGNTGQLIKVGSATTIAAGTCANTALGDSITLTYHTANTSWYCVGAPQGVWILN